jgi:hypothetical protein
VELGEDTVPAHPDSKSAVTEVTIPVDNKRIAEALLSARQSSTPRLKARHG